jgi:hypothetical protein
MTLGEFKAWLDGYCDGKDGLTKDELAKVLEMTGQVVPTIMPWPAYPATPSPFYRNLPIWPQRWEQSPIFMSGDNGTAVN